MKHLHRNHLFQLQKVKVKLISVFLVSTSCADEGEEEEENPLVIEGYTVANAVSKLEANAQLTLQYLKYNNLLVNLKKTKSSCWLAW